MLRQLVDGQARSCIDRLALDAATRGQYVCGPLPLVIRTCSTKAKVVQLVLAGVRIGTDRHREASTHRGQHVGVVAVTLGAA